VGDGVGESDEDGDDGDDGDDAGDDDDAGVLVPDAGGPDSCGLLVWSPTRAATLAEPDAPQATTNSAMRTTDMTRATTRCVVRRRDTDTWFTSWAPPSCGWTAQGCPYSRKPLKWV